MPGAYVAKPGPDDDGYEGAPPVDVVLPPPGWDPDWDFPPDTPEGGSGPYPPGYEPEYSLSISATGPVAASGGGAARYEPTSVIGAELFDQVTYPTAEPLGRPIVWTATIDGNAVADPKTVYYIASGVYWGYDGDFDFELDEEHEGKTLVVTATSTVFTETVSDVVEVEVYEPTYSISLSAGSPVTVANPVSAVVAVLYDHDTYATKEPANYELTFTATIDGVEVMEPRVESYISLGGGFWGHGSDFTFDLTTDHYDKTIILSVESTVFGEIEVEDSVNITVSPLPLPESVVTSLVFNSYDIKNPSAPVMQLLIQRLPAHASRTDNPGIGAFEYGAPPALWWEDDETYNTLDEMDCVADGEERHRIDATGTFNADSSYKFSYGINEGGNATVDVTFSVTITMSDGSEFSDSVSHVIEPYGVNQAEYVTVSTVSGMIYIFGARVN